MHLEFPCCIILPQQAEQGMVTRAVELAISAGYRHIDGAYVYKNEKEIGTGIHAMINQGVVKREELFVVSKVWYTVLQLINCSIQLFNSIPCPDMGIFMQRHASMWLVRIFCYFTLIFSTSTYVAWLL